MRISAPIRSATPGRNPIIIFIMNITDSGWFIIMAPPGPGVKKPDSCNNIAANAIARD